MPRPPSACLVLLALAFGSGCPAGQGTVLADLCTPADATDPFAEGAYLRVQAAGDVERTTLFALDDRAQFDEADAYPIGARVALTFDVLNVGDVSIARARTDEVTVQEVTQVCACLARLDEADRCQGLGCLYDADTDRCVFFNR